MFIIIDNYDSFTYNIVHYIEGLNYEVIVRTPDEITVDEIEKLQPDGIIISPGPGKPEDAKLSLDIVHYFKGHIPILGICLGFQVIITAFGGVIDKGEPVHGHQCQIVHDGKGIYQDIISPLNVARYHSLRAKIVPDDLLVTAKCDDVVMAVRHKQYLIEAVQYHPESILTEEGHAQLNNFLKECV